MSPGSSEPALVNDGRGADDLLHLAIEITGFSA
jgi:hypothetical protein